METHTSLIAILCAVMSVLANIAVTMWTGSGRVVLTLETFGCSQRPCSGTVSYAGMPGTPGHRAAVPENPPLIPGH